MTKKRRKQRRIRLDRLLILLAICLLIVCGCFWTISTLIGAIAPDSDGSHTAASKPLDVTIMLDPGHGGMDAGTIGINGVQEKDVNLEIAKKLGTRLQELNSGITITYTRDSDDIEFVDELDDTKWRTLIQCDQKPDFFISIHNDSFSEDPSVSGYTLYARSDDDRTQTLAHQIDGALQNAGYISRGLKNEKTNWIQVYGASPIHALFLECGFLSNEQDCMMLTDEDQLNHFVDTLSHAIISFMEQNPMTEEDRKSFDKKAEESRKLIEEAYDKLLNPDKKDETDKDQSEEKIEEDASRTKSTDAAPSSDQPAAADPAAQSDPAAQTDLSLQPQPSSSETPQTE